MITLEQIITAMAAELLADTALAAWITATYGTAHPTWTLHVQVGEDGANPPDAASGPVVVITPEFRGCTLGEDVATHAYRVNVDWLVEDCGIDISTTGLRVYEGTYHVDQLGQLIYAALLGISESVTLSQAEYGIDAALTWPLCVGGMTVTLDVPNIIGAEVAL